MHAIVRAMGWNVELFPVEEIAWPAPPAVEEEDAKVLDTIFSEEPPMLAEDDAESTLPPSPLSPFPSPETETETEIDTEIDTETEIPPVTLTTVPVVTIPSRINVALVGRPNVGKSSILNSILGYSRVLVHDSPGTTRDAIDTEITWKGQNITLVDTAGLKQRSRAHSESFESIFHYIIPFSFRHVGQVRGNPNTQSYCKV